MSTNPQVNQNTVTNKQVDNTANNNARTTITTTTTTTTPAKEVKPAAAPAPKK